MTAPSSSFKIQEDNIARLGKAKEALWQYEVKSEIFMQDVFDCIGVLDNECDTTFDQPRKAKVEQELERFVEFMEFVNQVLEHMIMDDEAVKRYRELQQDRVLAQQTEKACRL